MCRYGCCYGYIFAMMMRIAYYLLILVETFSEDMITTGICFSLDDSCMHAQIFHQLAM